MCIRDRSGLGDELNYVPVDKHTNQSTAYPNIFALGDGSNLPTSKAGSVAHFSVEVFVENFCQLAAGQPMTHSFDGHANCFVESGNGRALLLDFNYETEPLTGHFPLPVGPMSLLKACLYTHLDVYKRQDLISVVSRHICLNGRWRRAPLPLGAGRYRDPRRKP